ncbi:hypothetical protein BMS3Bbin01_02317 [bacterium BMS3Bbin01]|nr:hypothetical protein BMS3Bbin01_02317 [bacterium BMS3Bbin01]
MDARWDRPKKPEAALVGGPHLVFLSRDGRIRTGDLSVPKAGRGVCGGLGWTKAQVRALSKLL